MKTKKITKKESNQFHKAIEKLVLAKGFKPCEWYKWEKDTPYGMVRVTHWDSEEMLYSIFTRFDEPNRGGIFGCNPYSGKYNFHNEDEQFCFGQFEYFLDQLDGKQEV
jgi:hypothetical protein